MRISSEELRERVEGLQAWCESRIRWCRREEARLSLPSALEAATERRALVAVLEQLGLPVPTAPAGEAGAR